MFGERGLDGTAVYSQTLVRALEIATYEPDQPVEFVSDLRQAHIDVVHALLMQAQAFLRVDEIFGLEFLHLGLTPLDIGHHNGSVLESPDFLFEVHLYLV